MFDLTQFDAITEIVFRADLTQANTGGPYTVDVRIYDMTTGTSLGDSTKISASLNQYQHAVVETGDIKALLTSGHLYCIEGKISNIAGSGTMQAGAIVVRTLAGGIEGPQGPAGPSGSGTGDVLGPASATDNAIARYDATTGKVIQNSLVTISDTGAIVAPTTLHVGGVDVTYALSQTQPLDADLTAIAALADPNADRILFWDDSAGAFAYLAPSSSLAITTTTINTVQNIRTSDTVQFAALNLGHATDTTIGRTGAGQINVEGVDIPSISSAHTLTNKSISGATNTLTAIPISAHAATGTPSATTYLRGDNTWATPAGGSGSAVLEEIIVAANNSSTADKAVADYTCDGTADNVEIQSAITAAIANGQRVRLARGTFNIAAVINIAGVDDPDLGTIVEVAGSGAGEGQTILVAASNVNIWSLDNCVRVNMHDMQMQVTGTGSGIVSTIGSTTYRSFWQSNFRNLYFVGPWSSAHTGWAMDLTAPFRSTFENIEVGGTRNGIRLTANNGNFNPGDCTFIRCFIEIAGGSGTAYHLRSTAANAVMNQVVFIMCEAICDGSASTTGILMDGNAGACWNQFLGINLEQFAVLIDLASPSEGNYIKTNYIEARPTSGIVFRCASGANNNRFEAAYIYSNTAQTLISDANTGNSNIFQFIKVLADTSANLSISKTASTIIRDNAVQGAGTVSADFTMAARRISVGTATPTNAATGDLWVDTN